MLKELYWFKEDGKAFREKLKELKKENNLTINDLADSVKGYTYETVKKWFVDRIPDLDAINDLAKILNTTMEELYLPNAVLKIETNAYTELYSNSDENKFEIFRNFYLEKLKMDNCVDVFTVEELKKQKDFKEEINYLLQKRLFSFLTIDEEEKLRFYFKHALCELWEDEYVVHIERYDYDDFWNKIEGEDIIKTVSRKYTITKEEMEKEFFEFQKMITFAPYVYHDEIIPQIKTINKTIELIDNEEIMKAYLETFDKITLNCIFTSKRLTRMAKKVLLNMGAKKIRHKFELNDCADDIYHGLRDLSYSEYLDAIGGNE